MHVTNVFSNCKSVTLVSLLSRIIYLRCILRRGMYTYFITSPIMRGIGAGDVRPETSAHARAATAVLESEPR